MAFLFDVRVKLLDWELRINWNGPHLKDKIARLSIVHFIPSHLSFFPELVISQQYSLLHLMARVEENKGIVHSRILDHTRELLIIRVSTYKYSIAFYARLWDDDARLLQKYILHDYGVCVWEEGGGVLPLGKMSFYSKIITRVFNSRIPFHEICVWYLRELNSSQKFSFVNVWEIWHL